MKTLNQRVLTTLLVLALLTPAISLGQSQPANSAATASVPTTAPSDAAQNEGSTTTPHRSRAARRSYARETHTHRRRHISKGQVAMMAAVAGTSMGIGALAGGGTGLAIGSIVGGWSAYAVHRLWNHIR